jgi:nicotinamidase-related amidase
MDAFTQPEFESAALVTIDLQRDLLDGEPFCVPGTSDVLRRVDRLAGAWRAAGRPVVHMVRLYDPGSHDVDRCRREAVSSGQGMLRPGTAGSQLAPGVPSQPVELETDLLLDGGRQEIGPGEWVMYKPRWGAFSRTSLHEHLVGRGVTTVVVAGCNFPNCPRTTVYEASERDYRVVLVTDAVSRTYPVGEQELSAIGVALMTTDEVVGAVGSPALFPDV